MSSKTTSTAASRAASMGCFVFVGLFWSAITLTAVGIIGWGAMQQIQATGFPTAPGRVTQSSIESRPGKHRDTYSPKIVYTYRVLGKDYTGNRYRYMQWSSSYDSAQRIVDAFPVGRAVDVHYSPGDPSNAVLKAGLEGSDLFMAMFLTPFTLIMLGIWSMPFVKLYRRMFVAPAGGAKIVDDGFTTRVRLSSISPLGIEMAMLFFMAFLAVFPIAFTVGFNPPLQLMIVVWIVILIAAPIAGVVSWIRAERTENCLVIDDASRRVTLPVSFGRTDAVSIPHDKALAINVEKITKQGSRRSTYDRFVPTLVFSDENGIERREKLAEWSDPTDTAELAAWLSERLRLPAPTQNPDGDRKLTGGNSRDLPP